MPHNEPDLIFASSTQTAEQIAAALAEDGYQTYEPQLQTDQPPAAEPAPPPEEAAPPSEESGAPAGAEDDETHEPETPPAPTEQPGKKNKPGSARLKEERDRLKTDLEQEKAARAAAQADKERLERQIAELQQKPAEPAPAVAPAPAAPPAPEQETEDPQPQEDKFQDYAEYLEARSRWAVRDEARKQTQKAKLADEQAKRDRELQTGKTTLEQQERETKEANDRWNQAVTRVTQDFPLRHAVSPSGIRRWRCDARTRGFRQLRRGARGRRLGARSPPQSGARGAPGSTSSSRWLLPPLATLGGAPQRSIPVPGSSL